MDKLRKCKIESCGIVTENCKFHKWAEIDIVKYGWSKDGGISVTRVVKAIVEHEDGSVVLVNPNDVIFVNGE